MNSQELLGECSMSQLLPMEDLVRQLMERAGGAGGEAWLRQCLSAATGEESQNAALSTMGVAEGGVLAVSDSSERGSPAPAPLRRGRRSVPPERYSQQVSAAVVSSPPQRQTAEEEAGGSKMSGGGKKRRAASQSPAKRGGQRGQGKKNVQVSRGRQPAAQAPSQQQVPQSWGAHTAVPQQASGTQAAQLQAPAALLEQAAQQHVPQSQPVGELSQLNILSGLVGSLSGLLQSLSKMPAVLPSPIPSTPILPAVPDILSAHPPAQHSVLVNLSQQGAGECVASGSKANVPERVMKEAMPCEVSPLGYHLSTAVKEKIYNGEYIDILSLLPGQKEGGFRRGEDKGEDERRRLIPRSFNNWLQAFCIYAGVLGEKHPEQCGGLFQHVDHVLEAYKSFGGLGWFYYDESYRQKLAIHPALRWGMKDVGLWLNLMAPQKPATPRQMSGTPSTAAFRKGCCFAFNESQCRWNNSCKYRHECSICAGTHPAVKCFKKNAVAGPSQSQNIFHKSLHTSEAGKSAPVAGQLPRQGESMFNQ